MLRASNCAQLQGDVLADEENVSIARVSHDIG